MSETEINLFRARRPPRMPQDSAVDLAKSAIVSTGSIAWVPAAFGYSLFDVGGETAGVMLATGLGIVGVYNIADKAGLTE